MSPVSRTFLSFMSVVLLPTAGFAGSVEQREYSVLINGKDAGHSQIVIVQENDGRIYMKGSVTVKFQQVLIPFSFSLSTQEWWQGDRLVQMTSTCLENGKKTDVAAKAEADKVLVTTNGQVRPVPWEIWANSYWKLPDRRFHNNSVPILEADTGKDLVGKLQFVGTEKVTVGSKVEECFHFRVTGPASPTDLWYDQYHRLVRQEFTENGHRTIVHLVSRKN